MTVACQNKTAIYDILFKASAETLITIAADPKHLGARIEIRKELLLRLLATTMVVALSHTSIGSRTVI